MEKIKELITKRIFIMSVILAVLTSILIVRCWNSSPLMTKACEKGQYVYSHKTAGICSNRIYGLSHSETSLGKTLSEISLQNNKDKKYNRYNIAGHIAFGRELIYKQTGLFVSEWPEILLTIGHYEEAEKYIKSVDIAKMTKIAAREFCYNIGGTRKDFSICSKQMKENLKNSKFASKYYWVSYINQYKNDNIAAIESDSPMHMYMVSGMNYIKEQNYKKAIEIFEVIAKVQDYNYKAHEKLEFCYRKLGDNKKADEHARIMKEILAL